MKHDVGKYILLVTLGAITVSGCAKQELVKKDETIAPVAATTPVAEPQVKSPATETVVKEQPVKEAPLNGKTANASGGEADVKHALERIFFDFDSFQLTPAARDTLVKDAKLIQAKGVKLRIEGHCDERGSDEYNLALGEKRAKAARQYLVTLGISADNLSVISYGKEKPADRGHTEAAWAKNRRDEFVEGAK